LHMHLDYCHPHHKVQEVELLLRKDEEDLGHDRQGVQHLFQLELADGTVSHKGCIR
jgi:hypothetical protein